MTFPEMLESRFAAFYPAWARLAESPGDAAVELMSKGLSEDEAVDLAAAATFIARWRKHRAVYTIDDDLFRELATNVHSMSDTDTLPADMLLNLPYPAIAVQLHHPFGVTPMKGTTNTKMDIFAGEIMMYTVDDELRTVYKTNKGKYVSFFFPCQEGKTIQEAQDELMNRVLASIPSDEQLLEDTKTTNVTDGIAQIKASLESEAYMSYLAIQIVLYLQAQNSDIIKIPARKPAKKKSTKQRSSRVQSYNVGYNVGATIRREKRIYEDGAHSSGVSGHHTPKRPHIRRGHFHSFWTGKKDGNERKLVVRWVAPTYVHNGDQDDRVTIYPVKK